MRVVYSDETGMGSIAEEPLTVVTALMLDLDSQWETVFRELEATRPHSAYEFKGAKLFRALRNGRNRQRADTILRAVLSAATRHQIPIFYAAIDRAGYERRLPTADSSTDDDNSKPYDMALIFCLRSVHAYVYTLMPEERVLWIADKSGYESVSRQAQQFIRQLAETEPELLNSGVDDIKPHVSLVDTVYFADSRQSIALQLADVCCSVIVRHLRNDPQAEPYYRLIERQIIDSNPVPIFFSEFGSMR